MSSQLSSGGVAAGGGTPSPPPTAAAGVFIRPAERRDLATIHAMIVELAIYEKEPDAVEISVKQLENDFDAGLFKAHVAEVRKSVEEKEEVMEIAGFALWFFIYSTWQGRSLYLEDLYVRPTARGNGAGVALLRELASHALSTGCARFQWQALDWNKPAIDFYEKRVGAKERIADNGAKWVVSVKQQKTPSSSSLFLCISFVPSFSLSLSPRL